jgi:dual specificity phosphatase 12
MVELEGCCPSFALAQQQQQHPSAASCPEIAQIPSHRGILYIGTVEAAKNKDLLTQLGIGAVVSLGTGHVTPTTIDHVHCIDVLDMEDEFILQYFDACITFMNQYLGKVPTLVHCVYGQSRSATICVAYLMRTQGQSMQQCYSTVQAARPCIYINPEFLRQLVLFDKMQYQFVGDSVYHSTVTELRSCCPTSRLHRFDTRNIILVSCDAGLSTEAK